MANYKIGYIDEQEGERDDFANLMGDDDDNIEVVQFEVNDQTNINVLLEEILTSDIQCLVVDYHLSETGVQFEGSDVIELFHKIKPNFPKIIYTAKVDKVIPEVENELMYFINDKSIKNVANKSEDFRLKIKALIKNYSKEIDVAGQRLMTLTTKRKEVDLTIEEESLLFKSKQFLLDMDTRRKELPEITNEEDYFSSLKEANIKVDEILNRMRNA